MSEPVVQLLRQTTSTAHNIQVQLSGREYGWLVGHAHTQDMSVSAVMRSALGLLNLVECTPGLREAIASITRAELHRQLDE